MHTRLLLLLISVLAVVATVLVAVMARWEYGLALYAGSVVGLVVLLRRAASQQHRRIRHGRRSPGNDTAVRQPEL